MNTPIDTIIQRAASPHEAVAWGTPICDGAGDDAAFLLRRWEERVRKLHPDPKLFDKRLAKLGLDRATALDWLRPKLFPADWSFPSWAVLLEDILSPPNFVGEPMDRETLLGPIRGLDGPDEMLPRQRPVFFELAKPFLHVMLKRLRAVPEFERWMCLEAVEDVCRILLHRLSSLAARTLAYEVKQRSRACSLQGETSQDRYADFLSRHVGTLDGQWQLFRQYPVLARLLAVRTEQTIDQVIEIVKRLDADAVAIGHWFIPCRIVQLQLGLSDPHLGGRSVAILQFASGNKLVYKPRSLAVDETYAALLAWWNRLPDVPRLKSAAVISRPDYGWAEYIASTECISNEDVIEYFRRQGAHAAIFSLLRGTDFHSENFIAQSPWPVPIDLECLFSAVHLPGPIVSEETPPCFRIANTLFPTCMSPHWKSGEAGQICSIDGGISGNSGRIPIKTLPVWSGLETDALSMALERREQIEQPHCLPRLNGKAVGPEDYIAPLIQGFEQAYDALVAHREQLLTPGGLIEAFQDLSTRCIMRSTAEYTFLLSWATAPDQLTSGAAHDLAFEILVKYSTGLGSTLDWMDDEKSALWQRDVPFYFAKASSKRLTSASGEEVGPEFFTTSYEQVKANLMAATPEDRDWQSELLRATLQMSFEPKQPLTQLERRKLPADERDKNVAERDKSLDVLPEIQKVFATSAMISANSAPKSTDDVLLAEAIRLGEVLARQAIRNARGVTWLTLEWETYDPTAVLLGPVRSGLYSGGAGIALFLANLAVASGEHAFAKLAREALRFSEAHEAFTHSQWTGYRDRLAAFSSPYSQTYSLIECARTLNDDSLTEKALHSVMLQNDTPAVDNPDFINGGAGAICVLLNLHARIADDRLLTRAIYLAESIHREWRSDDNAAWKLPGTARPILGLAHGQVGIAMALARLDKVVNLPWLKQAVRQAIDYENEQFDVAACDWPNRWYEHGQGHSMIGWCGGAAGHGLARLSLLGEPEDDPLLKLGIEQALAAVQRCNGPIPQNLCCGEPGRIWFLAEAGHLLDRPSLVENARDAARSLIQHRRDHGCWHMRPVTEREILPTLMGGIAGIGLSLLEARCPGTVTQVLTLE